MDLRWKKRGRIMPL